jgi:hypothetical protein
VARTDGREACLLLVVERRNFSFLGQDRMDNVMKAHK